MNSRENSKPYLVQIHLSIFCFALYPILAVYAYNVEQLNLNQLLLPFVFSLSLGYFAFVLLYFLFKNVSKAHLGAVVLLLLFWNYRMLFDLFSGIIPLPQIVFLLLSLLVFFIMLFLLGKKIKPDLLKHTHTILIIPVSILILYNLVLTATGELQKIKTGIAQEVAEEKVLQASADLPDIYILIFDEFASPVTMHDIFGYDHHGFVHELERKGFFFARNSKTKFPYTHLSIPGIMNHEYPEESVSRTESLLIYNNNRTFRFLNQADYQIFFLDGWGGFEYTFNIPVAEFVCFYDTSYDPYYRFDEFTYLLMGQSMLTSITDKWMQPNANHYFLGHHYFLDYIKQFPDRLRISGYPRLLYAHVMAPHLPYVFDRDGNFNVNPTNYWEYRHLDPEKLRELYFEQYLYISGQILEITEAILQNSHRPPVILLFSDHGPRLESAGVAEEEHHHRVLNAVYFPDGQYEDLYDTISPVNAMRVLFNKYFDTGYEMLNEYSCQP